LPQFYWSLLLAFSTAVDRPEYDAIVIGPDRWVVTAKPVAVKGARGAGVGALFIPAAAGGSFERER